MSWIFRHPIVTVLILAVIVVGVGHRAAFVVQNNSPETLFGADEGAKATYKKMVDTFGGDEVVLVQLRGARPDRAKDLHAVARLERRLAAAPGVKRVLSPAQIYTVGPDGRSTGPLVEPTAAQVRAVTRELKAIGLYRRIGVYQPDAPALGALAVVVMKGPKARSRLAASLDGIRSDFKNQGYRPLIAGLAPANAAVDRELQRSLTLFMPLVAVVAVLIGWILFRSVRVLLAMFLPVLGVVILGVAGLEITGNSLNLVTAVMPPLVLAVSFAGAIHLVSHYASCCAQDGLQRRAAVDATIREKLAPTAFAYLTTAVGFGSLAISHMPSVRVLGLAAAGSLVVALVLVTVGTPCLILLLKPKMCMPAHRRVLLQRVALFGLRRRWWVIGCGVVLAGLMVFGLTRLTTNINGMDFLPKDMPERADYQLLEKEGLGLGNLDVWIHRKVPPGQVVADAERLAKMAADLKTAPKITGSAGVHDLLLILGYRMSGQASLPPAEAVSLLPKPVLDLLRLYWVPDKGLKLTLLSVTGEKDTLKKQRAAIVAAAKRHFPGAKVDISGQYVMLISTPGTVTETLVTSLSVTVGIIALLFLIAFRSPWLALGGMICNLLPVLAMIGTMGLLGVPMDVATVMIGSVAFGVAVDDTFHYLYHRKESGSIMRAARIAGQGIVATTLVIAGGFAVLGFSGFNPVVRLGLLLAYGTVVALVANSVLLPAIVGRRSEVEEAHDPRGLREALQEAQDAQVCGLDPKVLEP